MENIKFHLLLTIVQYKQYTLISNSEKIWKTITNLKFDILKQLRLGIIVFQ